MSNNKVKILIPYNKIKKIVLSNDVVLPVQTGCSNTDELFSDMFRDNDGENISDKNPKYWELTAQYWAWKNYDKIGNPDYVGFMQARRHFIFDDSMNHTQYTWIPKSHIYYMGKIPKNYEAYFSKEKITEKLSDDPDCITHKVLDLKLIEPGLIENIPDHLVNLSITTKREKILEIFKTFEKIIKTDYPRYYDTFIEFKNNTGLYCCNSYIMKKSLFFEYCEFLFDVLKKVDDITDSSDFNKQELKFLGYLGEYLLTVFLLQKKKENVDFKLKELSGVFLCDDYKFFCGKMKKYQILSAIPFLKNHDYYVEKYNHFKLKLGIL